MKIITNKIFVLSTIVLCLVLITYTCSNQNNEKDKKKVAIIKLGSHPLIDEIEDSIVESIKINMGDEVSIDFYNANFDDKNLSMTSKQVLSSNYDVVVPITTPASIKVISQSRDDQNIVFSFVSTPSLIWGDSKPTNVTGTSDQIDYEKNMQLIRKMMPNAVNIGYLVNQSEAQARLGLKEVQKIASKYGFEIVASPIGSPNDVGTAARSLTEKIDLFLVGGDNTVVSGIGALLSVAHTSRKPVFAVEKTSVEKGCVAAYGIDYHDLGKATAQIVIKVLNGELTRDIPVVYFKKTKLYVNEKSILDLSLESPETPYKKY